MGCWETYPTLKKVTEDAIKKLEKDHNIKFNQNQERFFGELITYYRLLGEDQFSLFDPLFPAIQYSFQQRKVIANVVHEAACILEYGFGTTRREIPSILQEVHRVRRPRNPQESDMGCSLDKTSDTDTGNY